MHHTVLSIPPSITVIPFLYLVKNLVQLIDDLVTENAELQQQLTRAVEIARREQQQVRQFQHTCTCTCKYVLVKGLFLGFSLPYSGVSCVHSIQGFSPFQELQQQLQSSEREKEIYRQQLTRKEAELTRAEETIRREQQQMRQLVHIMHNRSSGIPLPTCTS